MIEKVKLENWKSHHRTELEFEEGVNTLVGTMGSGKSSVLEAIVFGLYGTTPDLNSREVQLDDLIRRNPSKAEHAEIEIEFSVEDTGYSVKRVIEKGKGTKKSELRKEGELIEAPSTTEVTEQVEKILGMDFKAFTRAVYSEQNKLDLFLNMRSGKRKKRIDQLLELDRFEDARKTSVKVKNRFKDLKKEKKRELEELDEEVDKQEKQELEEEIKELEEKKEELEDKVTEDREEKEHREQEIEELEQLKQKYEEKNRKLDKLETKIETLEERKQDIKVELEIKNPGKRKEQLEEKIDDLREKKGELGRLEQSLENLENKIEKTEEEIEELGEKKEKYSHIDEIKEKLEEQKEKAEELKQKGNRYYAERKSIEESLEDIRDVEGECPTCGREMEEEHRKELVEERTEKIKELKQKEKDIRKKYNKKTSEINELEERKEELLKLSDAEEKLEEKQEGLSNLEKDAEELEEKIDDLRDQTGEEKIEKTVKKLEKVEKLIEKKQLEDRKEKLSVKKDDEKEELKDLEFDEESFEEKKQELNELEKNLELKEEEIKSKQEILEEKNKRLEKIEKEIQKIEEIGEQVENIEDVLDFLFEYNNALEETQVELRKKFVEQINESMDRIWNRVYPYDDYYSIRVNVEEDYLLEVLDSENNWVSAEAQVSGGERHSAALVMRMGLTFTLSPDLNMIMLDEPTHNLDSSAVNELAETLHDRTSELLDQMFLVTHDPSLESAATGKIYRFDKKGTETGLTQVEEVE